ncbi:putative cytochrome p450 monooxygenase protein [Neofusicoccum parvum UCRNP2]|uniref:Putative cytochrome p450 monooxygenase protein n=1 Tax=Botryosphaeria parva (strain UCR-NP2) TaxID=1287680 RepID=R1GJD0_BOTPV|nr:putative cytochrome p450 monooxygenase protein [Neofusicoccum parvum UCRNP2]
MQTGTEWKSHRRLLQDLMTPSFLEKVAAPAIYDSIHETAKLWTLKAQLAPEKAFSAASDIHHAALDAVLSFSFGKSFPHKVTSLQTELLASLKEITSEDDKVIFPEAQLPTSIQALIDTTASITQIKSAAFPRLKWELISRLPHLARAIRQKNALIRQELSKAVSTAERGGRDDSWVQSAVDHIVSREALAARRDNRAPAPFSPVLRDEVFGFLVAGHDTTSTSLAWGVKLLADHPPAQERLRAALRRAFAAAVDEDRGPGCGEVVMARVPYLDAVIEEILRVGGTVPAIDRQATCDTMLLGHRVPKGTTVFMLANGPGVFEPGWDVEEETRSASAQAEKEKGRSVPDWERENMARFMPERWLVPAGGAERDDERRWWEDAAFDAKAGPSMPFGGGVRGCFGRRLAYVEMRMFLVAVLWRFELLRCPEDVSGYEAYDGVVHTPKSCFVRLKLIPHT